MEYEYQASISPLWSFLIFIVVYVYFAYTLMVIANKVGEKNSWLAWIPIANIFLMLKVARLSYWWILGFFVPILNFILLIWIFMGMSARRGFNKWMGLLVLIPFIGPFIINGLLAWGGDSKPATPAAPVAPAV